MIKGIKDINTFYFRLYLKKDLVRITPNATHLELI